MAILFQIGPVWRNALTGHQMRSARIAASLASCVTSTPAKPCSAQLRSTRACISIRVSASGGSSIAQALTTPRPNATMTKAQHRLVETARNKKYFKKDADLTRHQWQSEKSIRDELAVGLCPAGLTARGTATSASLAADCYANHADRRGWIWHYSHGDRAAWMGSSFSWPDTALGLVNTSRRASHPGTAGHGPARPDRSDAIASAGSRRSWPSNACYPPLRSTAPGAWRPRAASGSTGSQPSLGWCPSATWPASMPG